MEKLLDNTNKIKYYCRFVTFRTGKPPSWRINYGNGLIETDSLDLNEEQYYYCNLSKFVISLNTRKISNWDGTQIRSEQI